MFDRSAKRCDRLWHHARLMTLAEDGTGLGIVENGIVAAKDGRILFSGAAADTPALEAGERIDCEGRWITPGLVDCHTHLVHAGNRAHEFEMRLEGASYEDIARGGGGILSTVWATRTASEDELVAQSLPRLDALIGEGVTTVEVKSGYGLSRAHEEKQLRAIRALAQHRDIGIAATFLGAHALPPEAKGDRSAYIEAVCAMIPEIARAGLADAVDGFCETIAFSPDEIARVFEAATSSGLRVKLHADQLSNGHGAALAARFHALSADHLEHADEDGIAAMAKAETTAVLLPGAFYFLREAKLPPVELLHHFGVPIALATDCNPGTSPMTSLLTVMNMGATLFRLKVGECIAAVTREAARALGRLDRIGTLEQGKACDLAIWDIESPADLVHPIGLKRLHARVRNGQ